jgi:paraquat-inducible protein B
MADAGPPGLSGSSEQRGLDDALPAVRIRRRRRWLLALIWLVPILAAVVAGYLVYSRLQELGPSITIRFSDANGVRAGQTEIRHRGVPVGRVDRIELSDDQKHAVVSGRLHREAAGLAREGSVFWIARPEVRLGDISRLGTLVFGPYIEVRPGTGPARWEFTGLDHAPLPDRPGLSLILAASQRGSVGRDSPVTYRGIEVGTVTRTALSRDATAAHVSIVIFRRYTRLVRTGSRFWTLGDVNVNVSLFKGLDIDLDSLRSLVTGGIAFATPEDSSLPPAKDGTVFPLHDKPEKEWLRWQPRIPIPGAD